MKANNAYSPYGYHQPGLGALGFNGEQPDSVTGHYHLGIGYRTFNPSLMRFHSPDTLSPFEQGGFNAYAYCQGDPINSKDPSGHFPWKMVARLLKLNRVEAASTPSYTRVIGAHATELSNVASLKQGLKQGFSLEGRRAQGEGVYFGPTPEYVESYRKAADNGVTLVGVLVDGVSLVPEIGYRKDPFNVTVITPAAYDVVKMFDAEPPGATPANLPQTGIMAKKNQQRLQEKMGAKAPTVQVKEVRGTRT